LTAAGIAIGNTLEAVVGAWLLGRLGFHTRLDRLRDVLALIVAAALGSTLISATIGVTSLCAGGLEPWARFWSLWSVWWVGDAIGNLVVAPLLLVWSQGRVVMLDRRRLVEGATLFVATAGAGGVLFFSQPAAGLRGYPLHYTVFPFVVWAALRIGQLGTTAVTCVASGIAIWSTVHGLGPFAMATTHESLIMLQLFMGVVATTGLLLGATIAERDAALARQTENFSALEVSEERLRLALEAGHLGVWEWNIATGVMVWVDNPEPIHGVTHGSSGALVGFRAAVHADDRTRVDEAIRRAVEDGATYDIEFRSVWPDGTVHWIAAKGKVIRDPRGRPSRMLGTAMEITERRRLEDELRQRAQELADADRRKDEFLAMLAHELRNPLAPLSTSLHLIGANAAERQRFLEMAERQVRHLVRLVDDLLDVSRISSGTVALRKEPLSLVDIINRAVELTHSMVETRGHALTVSLPSEPVRLEGDPVRLVQVVANLLSNAAKYTPSGGSIWVTAETAGSELTLRVRDTGVGLSPDLMAKIFDLFVQGETSLDRARGGLGIGLTLARGLVELHGGRLEAHSAGIGQGSEFVVRLPTLSAGLAGLPSPQAADPDRAVPRPLRVLIVEDNQDAAESLATMIELWGHQVQVAFDGFAALGVAEAFEPELIVSDLGLPGMDGYELARRMRAQPVFGKVVLVALSGYGREEDKRRALEAGFDHHQVKPLDTAWLFSLLGRVAAARADEQPRTLQ
jgi:PAS domain S-box-containing protein